jgi:hypothetical protein
MKKTTLIMLWVLIFILIRLLELDIIPLSQAFPVFANLKSWPELLSFCYRYIKNWIVIYEGQQSL